MANTQGLKDKNITGILALLLGWAGIHRFYLNQVGLGILYVLLMFTGISFLLGVIDAIAFFSMDQDRFDIKYNREHFRASPRQEATRPSATYRTRPAKPAPVRTRRRPQVDIKELKQNGIKKFRDYDFNGAIQDFEKALQYKEDDVALHFNLACAYSLNEDVDKALHHLDRAVANGFDDFDRIREHDALAYLRIQDKYQQFVENNFRLVRKIDPEQGPALPDLPNEAEQDKDQPDLLEQLNRLHDLREKGLLTEEEFVSQKRKLMG